MTASLDDTRPGPSAPRAAATILLLRETRGRTEVLMVRRHAGLVFMAGMWVFPGGSLHATDVSPRALALLNAQAIAARLNMLDLQGRPLPATQAAGLAFAACRETFEETGVLLAKRTDGTPCDGATIERAQKERDAVNKNAELFGELLQREQLLPDVSTLTYWAHWITPSSAPRRFDTRFFLLRAPAADIASADAVETVESRWMAPADLLAAARRNEMPISHPTQCNLHDLQAAVERHGSLSGLLAGEAMRAVVPILPKMYRSDAGTTIVMPWDETYETSPGDGIAVTVESCGVLAELPSRVVGNR